MESFYNFVSLVVFIPLIGMVINLFAGKYFSERGVGFIAVGASALAFVVSLILWAALVDANYEAAIVDAPIISSWIKIPSAGVDIPWQFRVDTLSVTMMLVVTGVGTLIHLYATGYMHGDERFSRFFVYLNLFLVFMLILVTGNNFLMMFVGWEGVGLCSFLLIGFWFDKNQKHGTEGTVGWANSNAARKAFIVNRVGDFGLLMGIFLTFWTFGTLDYHKPNEEVHVHFEEGPAPVFEVEGAEEHGEEIDLSQVGVFTKTEVWTHEGDHHVNFGPIDLDFDKVITLITLLFLLGAAGKSAQIPLFVWLPDAMAGPTPVSALIHAATMVTAGIYMMVRSNSLYHEAELSSFIVTTIGVSTALVAGFMALGQWDIKKVLAYSTVSQLGFMVAAVGIGAYAAAMFHLVTHAFFKALLFLGSGSVIHGVEHGHHHLHQGDDHHEDFDPQDMRNMGGLRKKMPVTYWTYLVGSLALAGVIPFAGFWSKDEILADSIVVAFDDSKLSGFLALGFLFVAAGFTAFYIWRQVSLVFFGKPRTEAADHAHESVRSMTIPLVVLAIGSAIIGLINIPDGFPILGSIVGKHRFTEWLEHSVIHAHAGSFNWGMAILATGLAIVAIYAARIMYYSDNALNDITDKDPLELKPQTAPIFALSNARLYWDESYFKFIVYPFQRAARFLANTVDWRFWHDFVHERIFFQGFQGASDMLSKPVDRQVIDGGFMSLAYGIRRLAGRLRLTQTGYVRSYALSVVFGAFMVIVIILFPVLRDLFGI